MSIELGTQQSHILSTGLSKPSQRPWRKSEDQPCGLVSAKMLSCDLATLPKQPLLPLHSSTFRIPPYSVKIASEIMLPCMGNKQKS